MSENSAPDPIAAAISATVPSPAKSITLSLGFGEGRTGALQVPADLTPGEILGLITFIAGHVPTVLAQANEPSPGILVPNRPRLVVPS